MLSFVIAHHSVSTLGAATYCYEAALYPSKMRQEVWFTEQPQQIHF